MHHALKKVCLLTGLGLLSGCASIVAGTSEQMQINTNPPSANCDIQREGASIAKVDETPSGVVIKKTKYDLTIICKKDGYQDATFADKSGIEDWVFGNIILGGLIGWGIDSASGADNHYETPVNITLMPVQAPAATPVPQPAPAPVKHQSNQPAAR